MRVRMKPWIRRELDENSRLVEKPTSMKGKWNEYFGNGHAIQIEIGCGKGLFVTQTAMRDKQYNFIAIERQNKVIASGLRLAKNLDCSLAFFVGDVKDLCEFFAVGEISRIYINFCDPWPNRKKWAKRRLTHERFLNIYRELFGEHGEIFFKTDNRELFKFSVEEFTKNNWQLRNVTENLHNSAYAENIMTEYEIKFSSKNMPIFRLEAYY